MIFDEVLQIDKQLNLRFGSADGYYDTEAVAANSTDINKVIPVGEKVKVCSFFSLLNGNLNVSRDACVNEISVSIGTSSSQTSKNIKGIMQDSSGNILAEVTLSSGRLNFKTAPLAKNTRYDFYVQNSTTGTSEVTAKKHTFSAPLYRRANEFIIYG